MAGAGKKTFVAGEVLTASDVNSYLMDQAVMRFATASARSAALPTPSEGMVAYLDSTNAIEVYNGASWISTNPAGLPYAVATASGTWNVGASLQSIINATSVGLLTITFPSGRFSQPPSVTATTLYNGVSMSSYARWAVSTVSASSVSLEVIGGQPGSAIVGAGPITQATANVHAIQMSASGAYG